uniref:Urechistachykinin-2 n=1 Tax=Urechis unicinctus TaxID=6432 RepID=TKU2_UREUN|nr:RecName: Full=Urechistachykinin-2; AltName: Full=Urechistachykinin II [Urechis unicinctus]AAB26261.1 urechistachykinin II=neuropeptide [Urechis unicinctus=echiuroid worms, ventral nerve cords, Peptide, 10 aa] [Urechis unicinctus]
AAGMGFFGAR